MATLTSDPSIAGLQTRQLLLPYTLGLFGLCAVTQIVIAAAGNVIDWRAVSMTVLIAGYYAVYIIVKRHDLARVRFARLVAHAVTYVGVVGSYQLHAAMLGFANSDQLRGDADFPIDPGWFGPTFAMAGFWAIGLAIHAVATIANRGYEN